MALLTVYSLIMPRFRSENKFMISSDSIRSKIFNVNRNTNIYNAGRYADRCGCMPDAIAASRCNSAAPPLHLRCTSAAFCCILLHSVGFHCISLHLRCIPLHSVALYCIPSHSVAFRCTLLHSVAPSTQMPSNSSSFSLTTAPSSHFIIASHPLLRIKTLLNGG